MEADLGIAQAAAARPGERHGEIYDVTLVTVALPKGKNAVFSPAPPLAQVPPGEPLLLIRLLDCRYADAHSDHTPPLEDTPDGRKKLLTAKRCSVSGIQDPPVPLPAGWSAAGDGLE